MIDVILVDGYVGRHCFYSCEASAVSNGRPSNTPRPLARTGLVQRLYDGGLQQHKEGLDLQAAPVTRSARLSDGMHMWRLVSDHVLLRPRADVGTVYIAEGTNSITTYVKAYGDTKEHGKQGQMRMACLRLRQPIRSTVSHPSDGSGGLLACAALCWNHRCRASCRFGRARPLALLGRSAVEVFARCQRMVGPVLLLVKALLQALSLSVHFLRCDDPDVVGQRVSAVHNVLHIVEVWREEIRYIARHGLPKYEHCELESARSSPYEGCA